MTCIRFLLLGGWLLACASSPAQAANWSVIPDGSGDATTINGGLALADSTDTVTVHCGTYYETQIILKSGVLLTSETGQPDCVTIDCNGNGRGFYAIRVYGATVRGFTVQNANTNYGGGIFTVSESDPHFIDCVFRNNHAIIGGGAYLHHSHVTCTRVVFENNSAQYFGGGVAVEELSDPHLIDCTITGNTAFHGAGTWAYLYSYPTYTRCTISGNEAQDTGGGLQSVISGPVLTDCLVTGNRARDGGGLGGWSSQISLTGCTVSGNSAVERGGAIFGGEDSEWTPTRSIVSGNCAPTGPQVWLQDPSAAATFTCTNVDTSDAGVDGAGLVTYTGAFFSDPLFCAPADCGTAPTTDGTYSLASNSPCLPGLSPGCGLVGALGTGGCGSALSVTPQSWSAIKSLYRGGGSR